MKKIISDAGAGLLPSRNNRRTCLPKSFTLKNFFADVPRGICPLVFIDVSARKKSFSKLQNAHGYHIEVLPRSI
jgi:hypothetical protein